MIELYVKFNDLEPSLLATCTGKGPVEITLDPIEDVPSVISFDDGKGNIFMLTAIKKD